MPFLEALPDSITVTDYNYFLNIFKGVMDCYLNPTNHHDLTSKKLIYQLLEAVALEMEMGESLSNPALLKGYESIETTKAYMQSHYREDLSLGTLADLIGYSKEAYCRLFKKNARLQSN